VYKGFTQIDGRTNKIRCYHSHGHEEKNVSELHSLVGKRRII
jgi:hypothetical protein